MPGTKTCLVCGKLVKGASYCEDHKRKRYVSATTPEEIARRKRPGRKDTRTGRSSTYGAAYRALRKRFLDHWVATVGPVCVGYGRVPHVVERHALTADHVIPVAHGGQHVWDNLQAMCLSCNARKKDAIAPR